MDHNDTVHQQISGTITPPNQPNGGNRQIDILRHLALDNASVAGTHLSIWVPLAHLPEGEPGGGIWADAGPRGTLDIHVMLEPR